MPEEIVTRDQVRPEDRWNVQALYASDELWEADFQAGQALPAQVEAFKGHLSASAETLAEGLTTWFGALRQAEKVYVYAHLRSDEDLGNSAYQAMQDRARSAYIKLDTAGSYLAPEILAIDGQVMSGWMQVPVLAPYRFWLGDLLRSKPHVLSPAEERLLAMAGEPLGAISKVFSVLKNVDLSARLPSVANEEGQQQKLTHALFIKLLESQDRRVRKAAFDGYYAEYRGNRHTIAAALDGSVKAHIFSARARNFGSAIAAALFDDQVDTAVYDALISAVHDALPAFYRYIALRKRLLGVEALHLYDTYVSVVPAVEVKYDYDHGVALVCEGLRPLGAAYVDTARHGLTGGWVDRYENVGKRSGAYSSGCYDSLPYILMNYTGNLESVFTLAHELGHSMHSHYSDGAQPYHLAGYRILVAEVASTTNESLLTHHLLSINSDRAVRAYLIDRYLNELRGTLFRQTMFAEFEKWLHGQVESGRPLTVETLDGQYYELVKRYFGPEVAFDAEDAPIAWEWSRIDHFFYNFYVYKYATGISSAVALASAIVDQGAPALQRYLRFLQSGGSDYPLNLLRAAGVDLTTPQPVASALTEFTRLVTELEGLTA